MVTPLWNASTSSAIMGEVDDDGGLPLLFSLSDALDSARASVEERGGRSEGWAAWGVGVGVGRG